MLSTVRTFFYWFIAQYICECISSLFNLIFIGYCIPKWAKWHNNAVLTKQQIRYAVSDKLVGSGTKEKRKSLKTAAASAEIDAAATDGILAGTPVREEEESEADLPIFTDEDTGDAY